jgi:hypothetical protein
MIQPRSHRNTNPQFLLPRGRAQMKLKCYRPTAYFESG